MIIYALLVCSITAFNITQDRIYYEKKFFTWMHQFEIEIEKAEEFVHRLNIFQQNDAFIQEHNEQAHEHGYTLGHNAFSHLTWDEFKSKYMGLKMTPEYLEKRLQNHNVNHTLFTSPSHEVPESIDWVKKGAVTPVKNQLQCGSCWSFSTTGAVEGAAFIESHQLEDLSEQELVDCDHNGDMGCGGGLMDHAFQWIIQHGGLCRESDYTYIAKQQQCKPCRSVVIVSHFQDVPSSNEQALKVALAKQPVSVAIEADQPQFQFYKSGVFSSSCGTKLDHGVLAVGYGTENGEKYWKVKNSWGSSWGLDGYILLGREMGIPGGQCGIAMVPSYPTAKVVEDELVPKTLTSSATISKCGDEHSNVVNFSSLSVTPKAPKRNQPIYFSGTGSIRTGFQNASFDIAVELGGEEVYSQSGCMCGSTHLPLPLGLGDLDIHGFDCPTNVGKFHEVGVTVKLPIIAPSGDYSIRLTGTENANALFCIKVDLELTDDQAFSKSKVYEYFTNE